MIDVRVRRGGPGALRMDLVLVPVAEGAAEGVVRRLGSRVAASLGRRVRSAEFRGRADDVLVHHTDVPFVLLGLGAAATGADAWRRAGGRGRQEAERQRARRVGVY